MLHIQESSLQEKDIFTEGSQFPEADNKHTQGLERGYGLELTWRESRYEEILKLGTSYGPEIRESMERRRVMKPLGNVLAGVQHVMRIHKSQSPIRKLRKAFSGYGSSSESQVQAMSERQRDFSTSLSSKAKDFPEAASIGPASDDEEEEAVEFREAEEGSALDLECGQIKCHPNDKWAWVQRYDELSKMMEQGSAFYGFVEGAITFPPSFKWKENKPAGDFTEMALLAG